MKFSVLIPNFNNEKYLADTIRSALEVLPLQDGEIILVDDCSTDGSYEIAKIFENKIHLVRNESNQGQELTTNRALGLAKGEYCVILHSDDLLHSNFYEVLSKLLDKNPTAVMAVGERDEIDDLGKVFCEPPPFYDDDYLIPGNEQAKVFLVSGFLPCQVMFRRSVVQSFGGAQRFFDVNLDGLLWFKTSLYGDVAYTQNRVCSYRRHQTSTTSNLNKSIRHMFEYYSTIKEMFNFSIERGVDLENYRNKAFIRISDLAIRYANEIIVAGDFGLAERYLMIAEVVDPSAREKPEFDLLHEMIKSESKSSMKKIKPRSMSYSPPDGSKPI